MHELAEIPCGQLTRRNRGQKGSRIQRMQEEKEEMSISSLEAGFAKKISIISDAVC